MDTDGYWQLVDGARAAVADPEDVEAVAAVLVDRLTQLGPDEIRDADQIYRRLTAAAYGWPLWGAAYVIQGGCSDDGFDYFLGWLVAQGHDTYHRAVADPDALADVLDVEDDELDGEEFSAATVSAYHRVTGTYVIPGEVAPRPDLGPGWDFDDEGEMRRRYPRLAGIFLN